LSAIRRARIASARSARSETRTPDETGQAMRLILLLILLLLVIGALPTWPYSTGWGYYPSGLGLVLLIVLLVILFR